MLKGRVLRSGRRPVQMILGGAPSALSRGQLLVQGQLDSPVSRKATRYARQSASCLCQTPVPWGPNISDSNAHSSRTSCISPLSDSTTSCLRARAFMRLEIIPLMARGWLRIRGRGLLKSVGRMYPPVSTGLVRRRWIHACGLKFGDENLLPRGKRE